MDVKKHPKGPHFTCFGTMRLTGDQKNFEKVQKKSDFFLIFPPQTGTVEEKT